jgi:hypothetical protein
MIEEKYISFETAKLATEKGAEKDLWSNQRYTSDGKGVCPYIGINHADEGTYLYVTQSLLARWIREKYKIFISIEVFHSEMVYTDNYGICHSFIIYKHKISFDSCNNIEKLSCNSFDTYEDSMEAGLQEALRMI